MKVTDLQRTLIISIVLHMLLLFISLLFLKQTKPFVMPSAYTVNLVAINAIQHREDIQKGKISMPETIKKESLTESKKPEKDIKNDTGKEKDIDYIEKKISLMAAKKRVEEKFSERKVISLKAMEGKKNNPAKNNIAKNNSNNTYTSSKGQISSDDYYTKITDEIRQQWVYPDLGSKNIEAIVSVKILRDGTAIVQKVEKSSGNALFDRSALRALARSSPLPPPPYEMEIGVRFYP
ncbi:MAG: TonB family protein [Nitrospirae bacterium]|jgi:colicin import membrane protein|nr:TonB family protein [Nitrospirota bacterium]